MILGNLTRDPEVRFTPAGQTVATFSVATNRRWTTKEGQTQEAAEYHDIVAWGKLAEIVQQFLKKGQRVYVEGRLQTRSWEGQDGNKRTRTEIVADNVISLDRAASPTGFPAPERAETRVSTDIPAPADELQTTPDVKKPVKTQVKKDEKPATAPAPADDEITLDDIPF